MVLVVIMPDRDQLELDRAIAITRGVMTAYDPDFANAIQRILDQEGRLVWQFYGLETRWVAESVAQLMNVEFARAGVGAQARWMTEIAANRMEDAGIESRKENLSPRHH